MYILRNATGNVVRHTTSERKREELLRLGYTEVEDDIKGAKPYVPKATRSGKTQKDDYPSVTADAAPPPLTRGGRKATKDGKEAAK